MTDREKFIKLFDEIGVKYKELEYHLSINDEFLSPFSRGLELDFKENGDFQYFDAWGE